MNAPASPTATAPATLLRATGLAVRRGRREVLHAVDVRVAAGEIVAVLGPNGAGKSTLLAALSGALPASVGTVERAGRVAAVLQTPGLARRSARANVELALAWWGIPRGERRSRAEQALAAMRADHLARSAATRLSGGEQRRVHLARAVAVGADVTLLDEPFDGLDPATHTALRDDTADALRAGGRATVVVLHERADAWAMADRVVVILDGAVAADGPPRALLAAPPTAAVARFLGYDGEMSAGDGVLLTRAASVRVDPAGDLHGVVERTVAGEDATRVRVRTPRGTVWATATDATTRPGDEVALTVAAAVRYDATGRLGRGDGQAEGTGTAPTSAATSHHHRFSS